MRKELPKVYDPRDVEPRIYDMWMEGGCFKAEPNPEKKPFSIVMPPPNVTGQLHMGHAMDATLQDILIRFKRMQGYEALWLPGTDHAGIATQIKVEENLRKEEGLTHYDLGRCVCISCSVVPAFVTPWTIAHQAPLSMGFSRQEY